MARTAIRFGIVGLGAFGETYLSCLRGLRDATRVEVTAVCSRSSERAEALARAYAVPRWYTDAAALANDPQVDVVCVVTLEQAHCQPALAALAAGKDVIVEKPVATSLEEADAMIAEARRTGRRLFVAQILRFDVLYTTLAERVAAGELGEIASLHARRNRPAQATARYRRTHPLLETGILDVDVMLWLTKSRVRQVRAYARTVNPGPTPDLVWGVLEFASGAIGVLETSWLAPDRGGIFTDDALNVVGNRGTARLDLSRCPLAYWTTDGFAMPDVFYEPRSAHSVYGALREELLYFIACLHSDREAERVPLAEVRHGLAVALALQQSAAEEREVGLPGEGDLQPTPV